MKIPRAHFPICNPQWAPSGFSLIECLAALSITLGLSLIVFQLFQQNAAVFNDQNTLDEMQQNARLVASQIEDEIRLAGQEMPIFASIFDNVPYEPETAIINGSTSSRINFRAGLSAIDTTVTGAVPQDFTIGTTRTIGVGSAAALAASLGSTPSGRFVYIWGPGANGCWGWIRASVSVISSATNTVTLTTQQMGDGCLVAGVERFTSPPTLSLEEATTVFLNAGSIWQASGTGMTNLTTPTWSASQEIGRNIAALTFTYYDINGNVLLPNTLANRIAIARVDVSVVAQTPQSLSNGSSPTFPLEVRIDPRNLQIR